ncbi:MAG: helix-turn-helix transcriptional regulator [Rhodocyclaceae bacterium]
MRTQRLLTLLEHLRGRAQPVAAERLAEELGVSVRTIYRDMAALQAMGAPLRGASGLGYQLEAGYFLPPLGFDADELDAIALGMRLVAARGDDHLADAARRVTAKLGSVLAPGARQRLARLPLRAVSAPDDTPPPLPGALRTLRRAIRQHCVVHLHYRDLGGRDSTRAVRPLGLTVFDRVWLLTGWCEQRGDFRNFRIERIQALEVTARTFEPEFGRRFEDYLKRL